MISWLVLALVSDPPVVGPQQPLPGLPTVASGCPMAAGDEIVVCKALPTHGSPRYGPSERVPDRLPGHPLQFRIGTISADGHAFTNARGTISDGVTFTVPF